MIINTIRNKHSIHKGIQIFEEIDQADVFNGTPTRYFAFYDKRGFRHVRNTRVKGGTLTALKGDIDFYVSQGWA